MLLNRLASLFVKQHDLAWYWAGFVLNLFSTWWGDPLEWHSFFGHSFRNAFSTLRAAGHPRPIAAGGADDGTQRLKH
jgi:hypothetical protein